MITDLLKVLLLLMWPFEETFFWMKMRIGVDLRFESIDGVLGEGQI